MDLSTNTAAPELLVVEGAPVKPSTRLRVIGAGLATAAVLVAGTVATVHYSGGAHHTPATTTVQPVEAPVVHAPVHGPL